MKNRSSDGRRRGVRGGSMKLVRSMLGSDPGPVYSPCTVPVQPIRIVGRLALSRGRPVAPSLSEWRNITMGQPGGSSDSTRRFPHHGFHPSFAVGGS
ncbi:Hypothetical protein NTJ_13159 [Nesidiocoris tenuis]|uniref:Uncharacterized protein n=1 Tax=Nesidiocoris tenuis TaxID=355587 RepID=A0ABN7BBZ5_9HEMI|nr:Hypothetical protein NTJ_13159 [Nesidiocoris tenuis]